MGTNLLKRPGVWLGVLVGLWATVTGRAETWLLANGDRLTGERITESAKFIEVQHAVLGRLQVPKAGLQPDALRRDGAVGDSAKAAQTASVPTPSAAKPEESKAWKRQIEVGYTQQSGAKEKQDLTIRGQVEGRRGPDSIRMIGRILRSEAAGKIVAERREGDFRWRHDVGSRLFAQALTTYEEDEVRNIDLNLEQQVGGGYRVFNGERHKASVGLGAVVQYLQREAVDGHTALLGAFFQDYSYQVSNRLKLVQESSLMVSDRGALNPHATSANAPGEGSYRFKFNTGVQSKLTDFMSLNVRFEYDYNRSIIESELRADQRLTTAIGYLW